MTVAIILAVLAALCLAFGVQWQNRALQRQVGGGSLRGKAMFRMLTNGRWFMGGLLLIVGIIFNSTALGLGTVTTIQPIGALALIVTTIINARHVGLRLNRATILAIACCFFGSVTFVLLAITVTDASQHITEQQKLECFFLLLAAVIIFGGVGVAAKRHLNAFYYIFAAGIIFGLVAVLIKIAMNEVIRGQGLALVGTYWYVLLVVVIGSLLGTWFVQSAHASGPPELVVAGITVVDPMVGIAVGIGVLKELNPDFPTAVAVAMALVGVLAIVGVVLLARYHPEAVSRREMEVIPPDE